MNYRIGS